MEKTEHLFIYTTGNAKLYQHQCDWLKDIHLMVYINISKSEHFGTLKHFWSPSFHVMGWSMCTVLWWVNIHCSIPVWFIVEIPSRLQCLNCGKLLNKYPKANWFCFLLSLSWKAKIPRPNLRAWLWKTEILWIQGISTLVLRSLQLLAALSTGLPFFHLCLQFFICF